LGDSRSADARKLRKLGSVPDGSRRQKHCHMGGTLVSLTTAFISRTSRHCRGMQIGTRKKMDDGTDRTADDPKTSYFNVLGCRRHRLDEEGP
jgi:hypothetical protein